MQIARVQTLHLVMSMPTDFFRHVYRNQGSKSVPGNALQTPNYCNFEKKNVTGYALQAANFADLRRAFLSTKPMLRKRLLYKYSLFSVIFWQEKILAKMNFVTCMQNIVKHSYWKYTLTTRPRHLLPYDHHVSSAAKAEAVLTAAVEAVMLKWDKDPTSRKSS